jgi:hypothetical protein
MPLPLVAKLLLGGGAVAGVVALLAGSASADEKPETGLPANLKAKVAAALESADPVVIRALAKQLDELGFKAQAKSLRKAATAIEQAMNSVDDVQPGTAGTDSNSLANTKPVRVLEVRPGEGPYNVAARVGMGAAALELRDANIPRDGKNITRQSDGKRGFAPGLEPGDLLRVPAHWPQHSAMRVVELPTVIAGDDDDPVRLLAGRVALEVQEKPKGKENRDLIATFQRAEKSRGRELDTRGLYDAKTALALAVDHQIVPPMKFADGSELYWPQNAAPAKSRMRDVFTKLSERDPQRAEEWQQAVSQL